MAKHISQTLTIQVSQLVRDSEPVTEIIDSELTEQIEAIISQLVGDGVLVEINVTE